MGVRNEIVGMNTVTHSSYIGSYVIQFRHFFLDI